MRRALLCIVMTTSSAFAKDVVTRTGKLDFELVQRDKSYVLRDEAYTVTFPGKPTVELTTFKFQNEDFQAVTAIFLSPTGSYGIFIKPMPKHWSGSAANLIDETRDGMLRGSKATFKKQVATKLGGLDGRHISAVGTEDGKVIHMETDLLWDREHRVVVALMTLEVTPARSATARAFVSSFSFRRGARGPLDQDPLPEGGVAKADALGFEILRAGSRYVFRDGVIEATFPERPIFHTHAMPSPLTLAVVIANKAEIESLGVAVLTVPDGHAYDPVKGLSGTRDGFLKQFSKQRHTETKAKVGGLDGMRIEVTGTLYGVPGRAEIPSAGCCTRSSR
jgi:hypothetical protein